MLSLPFEHIKIKSEQEYAGYDYLDNNTSSRARFVVVSIQKNTLKINHSYNSLRYYDIAEVFPSKYY